MTSTNYHNLFLSLLVYTLAKVKESLLLKNIVGNQQIFAPVLHKREPVEEFRVHALTTTI